MSVIIILLNARCPQQSETISRNRWKVSGGSENVGILWCEIGNHKEWPVVKGIGGLHNKLHGGKQDVGHSIG